VNCIWAPRSAWWAIGVLILAHGSVSAQHIGLGVGVLFPVDAPMAVSVPPLALRAALFERGNWSVETGFTWYRLSGLSMHEVGFPTSGALIRPFHSFVFPLTLGYSVGVGERERIQLSAGGFAAIHSIYEVDDERLAQDWLFSSSQYSRLSTASSVAQGNTLGWMASVRYERDIDDRLGYNIGLEWLLGRSPAPIDGRFYGESLNGVPVEGEFQLGEAALDYRALGLTLGVQIQIP